MGSRSFFSRFPTRASFERFRVHTALARRLCTPRMVSTTRIVNRTPERRTVTRTVQPGDSAPSRSGTRLEATATRCSPLPQGRSDAKVNSMTFQKRSIPPLETLRENTYGCFLVVTSSEDGSDKGPPSPAASAPPVFASVSFVYRTMKYSGVRLFILLIVFLCMGIDLGKRPSKALHNPVFESILPVSHYRFLF